jgi:hypothetical protein
MSSAILTAGQDGYALEAENVISHPDSITVATTGARQLSFHHQQTVVHPFHFPTSPICISSEQSRCQGPAARMIIAYDHQIYNFAFAGV